MKTYKVEITGTMPILIHKFGTEAEAEKATRKIRTERGNPREEAEKVTYRDKKGQCFFSAFAIPRCIADAGSNHKMKGSRKSLRYIIPSAVRIKTEEILILDLKGKPYKTFEVDSRPVTIPSTKGRIMRHRPRWDEWKSVFWLVINDNNIDPAMVHQLLTEAGESIGVGDFRPQTRGPFGTFRVTSWEEFKEEKKARRKKGMKC